MNAIVEGESVTLYSKPWSKLRFGAHFWAPYLRHKVQQPGVCLGAQCLLYVEEPRMQMPDNAGSPEEELDSAAARAIAFCLRKDDILTKSHPNGLGHGNFARVPLTQFTLAPYEPVHGPPIREERIPGQ